MYQPTLRERIFFFLVFVLIKTSQTNVTLINLIKEKKVRPRGIPEYPETICSLVSQLLTEKHLAWPPAGMSISTANFRQVMDEEFDPKVCLSYSHAEPHGIHHFGHLK